MLSKTATMLLGLINQKPVNAYEIIKELNYMNVKWWFNIADSTVYATIKTLEKRDFISGTIEKEGNMPDKTIYTITAKGKTELLSTLKRSILKFDYDTNIFSITAFFIDYIEPKERKKLLEQRLTILKQYLAGIEKQDTPKWATEVKPFHVANLKRMIDIVNAEISGTQRLLSVCEVLSRKLYP